MNKTVFLKVVAIIFVLWAISSTVAYAYYYMKYNYVEARITVYRNKLMEMNDTLTKLKIGVAEINHTYNELVNVLQQYMSRSVAIVVIDYGNGTINHFKVYFVEDVNNSVYNVTQCIADIEYTYYPSFKDVLINSINGVKSKKVNGTAGYYWLFYINFQLSQLGAYHAKVHDGDIITWNYTLVSW